MKNYLTSIIFGFSIVIAAYLLGHAFMNRNNADGTISVTGLGKANFTSDLIVWEGSFAKESINLQNAYSDLERDKKVISDYLLEKGITPDLMISSSATRAFETARILAEQLGYPEENIKVEGKLYHGSVNTYLEVLYEQPDDVGSIMIFGHNPGFTNFANEMVDSYTVIEVFPGGVLLGGQGQQYELKLWREETERLQANSSLK